MKILFLRSRKGSIPMLIDEEILMILLENKDEAEFVLEDRDNPDFYHDFLKEAHSLGIFLFIDYKGEEGNEIVNFIIDYEDAHNTELATEDELEELGEYEYDFFPDKIKAANACLFPKGYGLFVLPSFSDFYILFISRLENKEKLTGTELFDDESIPPAERYIQYFYD
jgi:hypothetical protein